jgi:hypothetical protein
MVNNEADLIGNVKSGQERKIRQDELQQSGQWAQVVAQVMQKVVSIKVKY